MDHHGHPTGFERAHSRGAFAAAISSLDSALAAFLLALSPLRRDIRGVIIGTVISILLVLWARPDFYNILAALGAITTEEAAAWRPKINFAWLYPIACLLTLSCGIVLGRKTQAPRVT
ncbi:MAG: hypothetical protein JHC85_07180 [Chthoniobacterales bacterium]|nr:hypothetical protein [Chthoniobacterales bacterium]